MRGIKRETPAALFEAAQQAHVARDYPRAIGLYNRALKLVPQSPTVRWGRAKAALDCGDLPLARRMLEKLAAEPESSTSPSVWSDLGTLRKKEEDWPAAERCFRRALAYPGRHAAYLCFLATVVAYQGRPKEARSLMQEAARQDVGRDPLERFNRGMARLALGQWEGWEDYASREEAGMLEGPVQLAGSAPRWDGSKVPGAIFLLQEQGIGDTLACARYFPAVRRRCSRLVVATPGILARFLEAQWLDEGIEVLDMDRAVKAVLEKEATDGALTDEGRQAALVEGMAGEAVAACWPMDLARLCQIGVFREAVPYLRAAPGKSPLEETGQFTIGICWRGNPAQGENATRSIELADLESFLEWQDEAHEVRVVSLQHQPTETERLLLELYHIELPAIADIADLSRVVQQCEAVLTVDSAPAHLAGAMGKQTLVLKSPAPDLRYPMEGDRSEWYPTMQLFRAKRAHEWEPAVAAAVEELRARVFEWSTDGRELG